MKQICFTKNISNKTCCICFELKQNTSRKYCHTCSLFVCLDCLNHWEQENDTCLVCRKPSFKENEISPSIRNNFSNHRIFPEQINETNNTEETSESEILKICYNICMLCSYFLALFLGGALLDLCILIYLLISNKNNGDDYDTYIDYHKKPIYYLSYIYLGIITYLLGCFIFIIVDVIRNHFR